MAPVRLPQSPVAPPSTATATYRRASDFSKCNATREGYRYQHVQAIIVAIDQYAEAVTGNRDFFLTKPPGLRRGDVP